MNDGGMAVPQEQEAARPGIVVLSTSFKLLYMNRRALTLLAQVDCPAPSIETAHPLTAPLHLHYQDIMHAIRARGTTSDWERFHLYSRIGDSTGQLLIKGFGLPDRRGAAYSRIVMLLSPHIPTPVPGMETPDGGAGSEPLPPREQLLRPLT